MEKAVDFFSQVSEGGRRAIYEIRGREMAKRSRVGREKKKTRPGP